MPVTTVEVPSLGSHTHLVHDGTVAVAVDAPRDPSALERAAAEAGVDLVAVADTHVHDDHVSGGPALARRHGADYLLSADEPVAFERVAVLGGDVLSYGTMELEVLATPGHTLHHQSFVVRVPGEPAALLSGGSLLPGSVGRTDLVDRRLTNTLARLQWRSARDQLGLDADTLLLPSHGFDAAADGPVTIGGQRAHPVLSTDQGRYADALVARFGPVPACHPHLDPLNRIDSGPASPSRRVTAAEVDAALTADRWVVDVRDRARHADGHLAGSVGVEYSAEFATHVGWLVPWGAELVLLSDRLDELAAAVRDLAGIGIEEVGVHVVERRHRLGARYRRADWADYHEVVAGRTVGRPAVVDVREAEEYAAGHLPGALHVPLQDVERVAQTLPPGELWVHCDSGYRAAIAASLLHRNRRNVVHLDDAWVRAAELGAEVCAGPAAVASAG